MPNLAAPNIATPSVADRRVAARTAAQHPVRVAQREFQFQRHLHEPLIVMVCHDAHPYVGDRERAEDDRGEAPVQHRGQPHA